MSPPILIVIDMLNDFFAEGPLADQRADLARATNELIGICRARGLPVIWVRQEFKPDLSDAFLDLKRTGQRVSIAGTDGCQILPELERESEDLIIVKKRYSAFFGTDLDARLEVLAPQFLILAGVNTHACIRTTAIDAYQRDWHVILARDCISSYDQEHGEVSMRYMDGKIGKAMTNAEIADFFAGVHPT